MSPDRSSSYVDAFASCSGSALAARLHPPRSARARHEGSGRRRLDHEVKHGGFRIVALKDGERLGGAGTGGIGPATSSRSPPP